MDTQKNENGNKEPPISPQWCYLRRTVKSTCKQTAAAMLFLFTGPCHGPKIRGLIITR